MPSFLKTSNKTTPIQKEKESLESQQYEIYKLKKDISNRKRRLVVKRVVQYSLT